MVTSIVGNTIVLWIILGKYSLILNPLNQLTNSCSSTPSNVECDKLFSGKPNDSRPDDVHPQLHPLLHLHERQVGLKYVYVIPHVTYFSQDLAVWLSVLHHQ